MPVLGDVIQVQISATVAGAQKSSFGVPLILGATPFPGNSSDIVRSYTTLSGVAADFATTTPEYLAAAAIFAQPNPPALIMIGRRKNLPTTVHTITVTAVPGATYTLTVNGIAYSYTAGGSDTASAIVDALLAALWQPGHASYVAGNHVTVPGGPMALGTGIADNTAKWSFVAASTGAWQASHIYPANSVITVGGLVWLTVAGGTSQGTQPAGLSSSSSSTVLDGSGGSQITWTLIPAWTPNTSYTGGKSYAYTSNGVYACTTTGISANVSRYVCTTGGASANGPTGGATGGPSNNGQNIVDGTAKWNYVEAVSAAVTYATSGNGGVNPHSTQPNVNALISIAATGGGTNYWIAATVTGVTAATTAPAALSNQNPPPGTSVTDGGVTWILVNAWASGVSYTTSPACYVHTAAPDSNVYLCSTAGISWFGPVGGATGGPSNNGTGITDGAAVWSYAAAGPGLLQNSTVTTATPSAGVITVTSGAGQWVSLQTNDFTSLLSVACDIPTDPGVQTDLNNILLANGGWYVLISTFQGASDLSLIAAWCEQNKKLFLCGTQDSAVPNLAVGSEPAQQTAAGDIAYFLQQKGYNYTAVVYHPDNSQFCAAAWAGAVLSLTAGSETWKFKKPVGVTPVTLTETQLGNITGLVGLVAAAGKAANVCISIAGIPFMTEGTLAGGSYKYIDTTRGLDALSSDIQTDVFNALTQASGKVPYTDDGITSLESLVLARLKKYAAPSLQFLQPSPGPWVSSPPVATLTSSTRASRIASISFGGVFAGAIHGVILAGTITS